MNIAERRLPQDGRIQLARARQASSICASPPCRRCTAKASCMRILDRDSLVDRLCAAGLPSRRSRAACSKLLSRPHGIMLVTGPTGSGKTTTLYTALLAPQHADAQDHHRRGPDRIPARGHQPDPGEAADRPDFARCLRSIAAPGSRRHHDRRDPRLRDRQIAVQAALTGHLVLSTLHTNNAAGADHPPARHGGRGLPARFDGERRLAQRLVRRLCLHCRVPYQALPQLVRQIGIADARASETILYRGAGCEVCRGTGYHGRTVVTEFSP